MSIPIRSHLHIVTFQEVDEADSFVRHYLRKHPQSDGLISFADDMQNEVMHVASGYFEAMPTQTGPNSIRIGEMSFDQDVYNRMEQHYKNTGTDASSEFIFHPVGYLELMGSGYASILKKVTNPYNHYQRITITCPRILSDEITAFFELKPNFVTHLG